MSVSFCQSEHSRFEPSMDPNDSSRYWIEASVQMALATLFSYGIYNARVINHSGSSDQAIQGLIQVEEIQSPITSPVAVYISNFVTYNEKDCRAICKEIATCIKIMHDAGIAHRNLHLANVEIDPFVSSQYCFAFIFT
jgi:serine/threonine protein kinase